MMTSVRHGSTRMSPIRYLAITTAVAATTFAACGNDDGDGSGGTTASVGTDASVASSPVEQTSGTATPETVEATPPAPAGGEGCPSDAAVSEAAGQPIVLDVASSTPGFFCPYSSTDADESVTFSVTYTNIDMTSEQVEDQEEVPGLGERALWSEGSGEMVVWTGESSIIVSVLVFGQPEYDELGLATRVAQLALS